MFYSDFKLDNLNKFFTDISKKMIQMHHTQDPYEGTVFFRNHPYLDFN